MAADSDWIGCQRAAWDLAEAEHQFRRALDEKREPILSQVSRPASNHHPMASLSSSAETSSGAVPLLDMASSREKASNNLSEGSAPGTA